MSRRLSARIRPPTPGSAAIASWLMIPAIVVSFTIAELAGAGLQAALGLAENESLRSAGFLGVLAAAALTVMLIAPQVAGIALGLEARRGGLRRSGTAAAAANLVVVVCVVLIAVLNLLLG